MKARNPGKSGQEEYNRIDLKVKHAHESGKWSVRGAPPSGKTIQIPYLLGRDVDQSYRALVWDRHEKRDQVCWGCSLCRNTHTNYKGCCFDKKRHAPLGHDSEPFVEMSPLFYVLLTFYVLPLEMFFYRLQKVFPMNSLMLWSLLLWAPTACALAPDHGSGLHDSPWMEAISMTSKDLLSVGPSLGSPRNYNI